MICLPDPLLSPFPPWTLNFLDKATQDRETKKEKKAQVYKRIIKLNQGDQHGIVNSDNITDILPIFDSSRTTAAIEKENVIKAPSHFHWIHLPLPNRVKKNKNKKNNASSSLTHTPALQMLLP